jgi:CHAD domain-containing protein
MYCAELAILLHRALETRVRVLTDSLAQAEWQTRPERLHEVRVASRRLRAVLGLVTPELYPGFRRHSRNLRGLTRALGRSRELDAHLAILDSLRRQVPGLATCSGLEHVLEVLDRHRRAAGKAMAHDLAGLALKHLPELLEVPSLPDPFRSGELVPAVWEALAPALEGAFAGAPHLDQEDPEALHLLRIRIKRLRYTLEVLAPAFLLQPQPPLEGPPEPQDRPKPPERLDRVQRLERLKQLQTALGDHHDRATLEARLAGLLRGLEARRRPVLAAGVRELLDQLGDARLTAFEQFRALALATPRAPLVAGLRHDLGLAPEGADLP